MSNLTTRELMTKEAQHFMAKASPSQREDAATLATAAAEALALHEYKGAELGHVIPGWVYDLARRSLEDRKGVGR